MDTMPLSSVECAYLLAEQRRLRRPDLPPAVGPVPDPSSNERFTVLEVDSRVDMAEALDCLYRKYLEQSRRAGLIPPANAPDGDPSPDGADGGSAEKSWSGGVLRVLRDGSGCVGGLVGLCGYS